MTRRPWQWVWASLMVAFSGSNCLSQLDMEWGVSRVEQEIWKFLAEAIEEARCSEEGARAIHAHLLSHGLPWSVEVVWSIDGLTPKERLWLVESEEWRQWVSRKVHSTTQGDNVPKTLSVTRERRQSSMDRASILELRSRVGGLRLRARHQDTLQLGGSWVFSREGLRAVIGDHGLAWGHGLTVPRADMFGLSLFLGDAEMQLHNPPRGLIHSNVEGGFRGLALERHERHARLGFTCGRNHLGALVARTQGNHEVGWTMFKHGWRFALGPHWTARLGPLHVQCAGAISDGGVVGVRASWRWAHSSSWMTQAALDVEHASSTWLLGFRGYATWLDPQTGAGVQVRLRRHGSGRWDVRAKGIPERHTAWNWSFVGNEQSTMVGVHAVTQGLRCVWWLGRDVSGRWSQARHVEVVWHVKEVFSIGLLGMEGQGDVSSAFVMVPNLDAKRWSRLPHQGQRMGLWLSSKKERHAWTMQWTWSPSQQETFRCALRWRWDA